MEPETTPTPSPVPTPVASTKGKGVVVLIVAAVVLLVVILGLAWFFLLHPKPTPTLSGVENSFNQNNVNAAAGEADALLAKDPNNVAALIAKSIALAQKGSLEFKEQLYGGQAAELAKKATELAPNNSEAWRALGYANEIMQKYADAHQAYAKAIALDPKNALAVFNDAHAYNLEGNLVKAEAGYRTALSLNPNIDQAHAGLGKILLGKKDTDGALKEFQMAHDSTKNAHTKAEAAYSIAMIQKAKHNLTEARTSAEEATTLDPIYPLGWYGLGAVMFAQSVDLSSKISGAERGALIKGAITQYNAALTLNPNQSVAYLDEAIALSLIGKSDLSVGLLSKAEEVVPADISLSASEKTAMLAQIKKTKTAIEALVAAAAKKK